MQPLVTRILGQAIARIVHQGQPGLDLGQWCPQLVRGQHHELALDAINLAQLGEGRVLELDGPAHLGVALADELAREQVAAQRDNEQEEEPRHQRIDQRGVEMVIGDVEPDHEICGSGDERAGHAPHQSEAQAAGDDDNEEGDGKVGVVSTGQIDEPAGDREVEDDGGDLEAAAGNPVGQQHDRRRQVEHAPGAEHQVDRGGGLTGGEPREVVGDGRKDEHHPAAQLDRPFDARPAIARGHRRRLTSRPSGREAAGRPVRRVRHRTRGSGLGELPAHSFSHAGQARTYGCGSPRSLW